MRPGGVHGVVQRLAPFVAAFPDLHFAIEEMVVDGDSVVTRFRVTGLHQDTWLGVAPTGATPEYYHSKGLQYPPEYGPLAAVTPGTPGGLLVMLAEYGTMSLADVLAPAIQMADGFPIEAQLAKRQQLTRRHFWLRAERRISDLLLPGIGVGFGGRPVLGGALVLLALVLSMNLVATIIRSYFRRRRQW